MPKRPAPDATSTSLPPLTLSQTSAPVLECLSQREWLLKRPDAFIGSTEPANVTCLIANGSGEAVLEEVWTSPALLRLATELTTNALDNSRRSESQKRIDVRVTPTSFHVSNDGDTLSVEKFEEGEKWVPEVAFSEFLSSTNYDDSVERLGAGRNGVGAKGCNVYSTRFEVEVQSEGRQFRQEWRDNLTASKGPSVKKVGSKKSHTKVTWCPDLALLKAGEDESDETSERDAAEREEGGERARSSSSSRKRLTQKEMEALRSLAYHVAVCAPPRVGVFLDDQKVQIKSTEQLAASLGAMRPIATDTVELEGELRLSLSVGVKEETSGEAESTIFCFVNGTPCSEGTHVKSFLSKVWDIVQQKASKKDQDLKSSLKPTFLLNGAGIVMVCTLLVPNPRYANQQKTELATPLREFGFTYSPSERFVAKLASTDLVSRAIRYGKRMLDSKLSSKKNSSASASRVSVPKYQPAEKLRSGEASLFVTEGDSALNFAVAGLSVVGRKHYGVFPIRGKLLNCCNASSKKLLENKEVQHLLAILGLDVGRTYTGEEKLNYEHLIVLSDQDPDGSHIRGLLICFLHSLVPTLLETRPDYVQCFATPLLRVVLPHKEGIVDFFSDTDYRAWAEDRQRRSLPLGRSTYYKGLGALPNALAKEIFSRDHFRRHLVTLRYEGRDACGDRIALFFDEGMADRRKEYLSVQYDPAASFDFSAESASIKEWCEKDLSHYAMYNNTRTFPSVVDGLKTSQRKVLHACFRFNLTTQKEMKVYQLVGKVAAETGYHHGDASLTATITTMAAEHCNNVVLLWPEGQFGSAMCHKPASSRYISTCLEPIARKIFRPEDDPVLEYVEDEGKSVEPVHFVPIVPMVLVNGASGIGSGWSTDCPSFHPMHVLNAVLAEVERMEARAAAEGEQHEQEQEQEEEKSEDCEKKQAPAVSDLVPWYRGFEGTIQLLRQDAAGTATGTPPSHPTFITAGTYEVQKGGGDVLITSLPIGSKESNEVVEDLKKQLVDSVAIDVQQKSTPYQTRILVHSTPARLSCVDLDAKFSLQKKVSCGNIHLWDASKRLRRFDVGSILSEHASARLDLYAKRLSHQTEACRSSLSVAEAKRTYIGMVRSGEIDVVGCASKAELEAVLASTGRFPSCTASSSPPELSYLTGMPQYRLTLDEMKKLEQEEERLRAELEALTAETPFSVWKRELEELREALLLYDERCMEKRPQARDCKVPSA